MVQKYLPYPYSSVCAPRQVTEHVPLHSKLLCQTIARPSGGVTKNIHPLSWGGAQTEKIQFLTDFFIHGHCFITQNREKKKKGTFDFSEETNP